MIDYKKAGVDIDKANLFLKQILPLVKSTRSRNVISDLGPFAGSYSLKEFRKLREPVLVASCDGVGTKIKLSILTKKYWIAGYDLVAMNVNDIITTGAKPLFFLDYFAMSKLEPSIGREVLRGISKGCLDSGMSLLGGETAELPSFYKKGEFELAGFALGIGDREKLIRAREVKLKDVLLGLASSGPHSNGYSLIRKLFTPQEVKSYWKRYLLRPTYIYVKEVLSLIQKGIKIKAMAHITGGGFYDNIERTLPVNLDAVIKLSSWQVPAVFREIQRRAGMNGEKMYRTFNMGIGFVLIVPPQEVSRIKKMFACWGKRIYPIGEIVKGRGRVRLE